MQLTDPVKSEGEPSIGFDMAMQSEKLQKSKNKAIIRMTIENWLYGNIEEKSILNII